MAHTDPLVTLADRLRREEGESAYEYLSVLLKIKKQPRIWEKKYRSFKRFLEETGHGPYARFARFEKLDPILDAHDLEAIENGDSRTKSTFKIIGFEAASQILHIDGATKRAKVIEALREQAVAQGKPLTYQAAVNTIFRVLKLPKRPTTARGATLRALKERLASLEAEKLKLKRVIAKLRRRLRDHGLSDQVDL